MSNMSEKKLYKVTATVELMWYGEEVSEPNSDLIDAIKEEADNENAEVYFTEITKTEELTEEFLNYFPYGSEPTFLHSPTVRQILERAGESND